MGVRCAVLTALVLLSCSAASAWGWARGDEGKLAFDSFESGQAEIWTINPDGTAKTQLTADGPNVTPTWSPSGALLAFGHQLAPGNGGTLQVMRANGTARHDLTTVQTLDGNPTTDLRPSWSRDGRQVGFVRSHSYPVHGGGSVPLQNIYAVPVTGGSAVQLTDFGPSTEIAGLAYSPDGTQIVFTATVNGLYDWRVYMMRADGGDLHEVAGGPAYEMGPPDWSPSGIVFSRRESGRGPQLTRLSAAGEVSNTSFALTVPQWSPAERGLRIADVNANGNDVYTGDIGGTPRRLTWDGAQKQWLSWQAVASLPSRPAIALAVPTINPTARTVPAVVHCPAGSGICALRVRITVGSRTVGALAIRVPPGVSRRIRIPVRRRLPSTATAKLSLLHGRRVVARVTHVPVVRPVTLSVSCGSTLSGTLAGKGTAGAIVTLLAAGPGGTFTSQRVKAGAGGSFSAPFDSSTAGAWQIVAQYRHQRSVPCSRDIPGPTRTNASIGCPATARTGDTITVSGSVGIAGATVTLSYQPPSGDPLTHDVTTDGTGAFAENQILWPGTWTVTASYGGDPGHAPASATCTIQVTKASSSLTIGCPSSSKSPGGTIAIDGTLSPRLAHQTITLTYDYVTGGGTVTTVRTVETDISGAYHDDFATTTTGTLTTHASWPGNDTNDPATSPGCVTQVS